MKSNYLLLIALSIFMLLTGAASASVEIPAGTVSSENLNTEGETYILLGDVTATGTAFLAGADGITLDGMGNTITYATTSNGYAFSNTGYDGVTLKNVSIVQDSSASVTYPAIKYSSGSIDGLLDHVTLETRIASGLSINDSSDVTMRDCSFDTKGSAATATYSSSLYAYDSLFSSDDGAGASLSSGNGFIAERCTFTSSSASLHALSMSDRTNTYLDHVVCTSGSKNGLYTYNCSDIAANNVSAEAESNYGAWIRSTTNATFTDSQFSSVDEAGSTIVDCTDVDGAGCTFTSTDKIGVRLSNSGYCNFTGTIVHSPLANTTTNGKKHLMLEGDSLTEGSAALIYGGYQVFMPSVLGSDYVISNQGIGGTHADFELKTIQAKLEIFNPDVVTLMIGSNDIAAGRAAQPTVDDVMAMAAICKASGARVFIALTPARLVPSEAAFVEYVTLLKSTAESEGYPVINAFDVIDTAPYNSAFDGHNSSNYLSDHVHPNTVGNTMLGEAFANEILASYNIFGGTGLTASIDSDGTISYPRGIKPTDFNTGSTIVPSTGILNVTVSQWQASGNFNKAWTETSASSGAISTHLMSGFPANTMIKISKNGSTYVNVNSDADGVISWPYTGGFSSYSFTATPITITTIVQMFWAAFGRTWWLALPVV